MFWRENYLKEKTRKRILNQKFLIHLTIGTFSDKIFFTIVKGDTLFDILDPYIRNINDEDTSLFHTKFYEEVEKFMKEFLKNQFRDTEIQCLLNSLNFFDRRVRSTRQIKTRKKLVDLMNYFLEGDSYSNKSQIMKRSTARNRRRIKSKIQNRRIRLIRSQITKNQKIGNKTLGEATEDMHIDNASSISGELNTDEGEEDLSFDDESDQSKEEVEPKEINIENEVPPSNLEKEGGKDQNEGYVDDDETNSDNESSKQSIWNTRTAHILDINVSDLDDSSNSFSFSTSINNDDQNEQNNSMQEEYEQNEESVTLKGDILDDLENENENNGKNVSTPLEEIKISKKNEKPVKLLKKIGINPNKKSKKSKNLTKRSYNVKNKQKSNIQKKKIPKTTKNTSKIPKSSQKGVKQSKKKIAYSTKDDLVVYHNAKHGEPKIARRYKTRNSVGFSEKQQIKEVADHNLANGKSSKRNVVKKKTNKKASVITKANKPKKQGRQAQKIAIKKDKKIKKQKKYQKKNKVDRSRSRDTVKDRKLMDSESKSLDQEMSTLPSASNKVNKSDGSSDKKLKLQKESRIKEANSTEIKASLRGETNSVIKQKSLTQKKQKNGQNERKIITKKIDENIMEKEEKRSTIMKPTTITNLGMVSEQDNQDLIHSDMTTGSRVSSESKVTDNDSSDSQKSTKTIKKSNFVSSKGNISKILSPKNEIKQKKIQINKNICSNNEIKNKPPTAQNIDKNQPKNSKAADINLKRIELLKEKLDEKIDELHKNSNSDPLIPSSRVLDKNTSMLFGDKSQPKINKNALKEYDQQKEIDKKQTLIKADKMRVSTTNIINNDEETPLKRSSSKTIMMIQERSTDKKKTKNKRRLFVSKNMNKRTKNGPLFLKNIKTPPKNTQKGELLSKKFNSSIIQQEKQLENYKEAKRIIRPCSSIPLNEKITNIPKIITDEDLNTDNLGILEVEKFRSNSSKYIEWCKSEQVPHSKYTKISESYFEDLDTRLAGGNSISQVEHKNVNFSEEKHIKGKK